MTEPDPRSQQLQAAFSAELEERVQALNRFLLRLEREDAGHGGDQARTETLDALFREAHSLKGAARAVELTDVEQVTHALESALDAARRSGRQPAQPWFDTVYRAVDTLAAVGRPAPAGKASPPEDPGLSEVLAGLQGRGLRGTLASTPAAPPVPAAALPAPAGRRDTPTSESVRVAVVKLDALLSQAGELSVTQLRIEQRLRQVRELRQDVAQWRREWRGSRGLRAGVRRAAGQPAGTEAQTGGTLRRELDGLLRFVERAERRTQTVLDQIEALAVELRHDTAQLGLVTRAIGDAVMGVRLLPVATIFAPFERMVRDLTRESGKEAQLVLTGGETEIDRKILEQLRDPLVHMLRNAADHGIELPERRAALGKPPAGTIRLAATQRGSTVEIELTDDGAGIDPSHLRQSAVKKGLLSEEQASGLDDRAALELIFRPGFSTSITVTDTSGRGVGMDVVREHLERLSGQVAVSSVPGQGTRLALTVPLTLATSRAILVEQTGQLFAVPSAMVERTARVQERQLVRLEGRLAVEIGGHPLPVVDLAAILEHPTAGSKGAGRGGWRPFFVLRQGERRVALLADRLVGEQEIVVKRLSWPLRRVRNVAGATVLGSGQVVPILNPSDLLKTATRFQHAPGVVAMTAAQPEPVRPRLLVVDDSLTTRTLERSILEAAGYEVTGAADGLEALGVLRAGPIDLVVSDVNMPGLDGFGLTAEIRRDAALRQIPVVLVTSLDAREHRERGVAAGADAYIVKGRFDQTQLLETIGRLL